MVQTKTGYLSQTVFNLESLHDTIGRQQLFRFLRCFTLYRPIFFIFFFPLLFSQLEEETSKSTKLGLLLSDGLEGLVNGGNSQQNTSSGSDGAHQIGSNGKGSNAQATEGSGSGDVTVEGLSGALVTVTANDHLLVLELLGNILRAGARNIDPGLGEQGARSQDEGDVENSVERIREHITETAWGGDVVRNSSDRDQLTIGGVLLPNTEKSKDWVSWESLVEQLGEEEEVGNKGTLQNDGNVAGVEKLDGVGTGLTTHALGLDGNVDTEALEVDDNNEHDNGGEKVGDVGGILSVKSLLQSTSLIGACNEKVEESDDGSFELGSSGTSNSGRREGLPDDLLANVGSNEERDTTSETIPLLEELIKDDDDDTGEAELSYD
jgi:hypothetical protein